MKRHFFKQSLLRTMMIVATLLFMMPAQNAWADNVATATVDGNTYNYSSLEAAVSAANGAQSTATVTLLKDITEQPCSLEVRKPMIIDLNGHTVNADNLPYAYGVFSILNNSGQVVIKNGTISRMGASGNFVYAIYNYCNDLILENVTVKNTYSAANPCLYNNGTLTISKNITLVGSIKNSGTVQIASGQTLYDKNGIDYYGNLNSSRVANLANNTLSSLVTVTANGTTTSYNSLQDAVSAANSAESAATITLNHDITEQPCSLEVRKPMIIDLNGHTVNANSLTYEYGIFSIMNAEGQVIIKNGTISRRGVNDYNGFAIYNYNSNVELENVTVKNTYSTDNPCLYNKGTLTISKNITLVGSIKNSGTVQIASGQKLYDKNGIEYSGYINSQVANLANNTLSSLVTVTANGTTTSYNSLQDAVSAANSAESAATITLNHDITEQTCSLEVRKPMIIDLNEHVVNANNLNYGYGIFSIMNAEGQVIIKNGTISRRGENDINGFAIYNYNSNLELENVTVKNTYSATKPCLYNNGTLTISKNITLVGSIKNSGTVQIASGQTLYDKNGIEYSGYINSRVANLANNTLSSLVTVTANGTTTPYNSLQDAVSAAANAYTTYGTAATITLNRDITEQPCSLEVRKPMIIDLNGHVVNADNLTYAYGIFSIMNAEGQVIIKNGTISRRGVNNYNGFAIYNYNSNVELENVTVKNTYSATNPCLYNSGTLTISKNITLVGSIKNSGTVQIVDGQLLGDASGKYYLGTLTSAQVDALSNNTLSSLSVVASGSCGTDVKWALTGTSPNYTLTISGTGAIPSNPWYSYKNDITTVVINNGVTGINMSVFMNTPNLTSVTIPASVSYIGQQVFDGCTNLEMVSGCEGVTKVGNNAFRGTKWLTDQPNGVIYIGKVAYLGKNVSGEVNIKAGTVSISSNAFKDCTNLTSIEIPNSVTSIGDNAFQDCTSLTSITIPNSVTYIGSTAFRNCTGLTSITIPNGVTKIYEYTFQGCTSLTSVTIPSSVEIIGGAAFYNSGLTSITIPNNVFFIQSEAFYGCSNLETVTVYATTPPTLGNDAFNSCHEDLQIYVFSGLVDDYQSIWYQYCQIIKGMTGGYCGASGHESEVVWVLTGDNPYTLTISGTGAMKDYGAPDDQPWKDYRSLIASVVIEDGVTSIGNNAFNGCSNLAIVYMQSSTPQITTWGTDAFANLVIAVPAAAYNSYYTALEGNSYQSMLRKNIATCSATVPNPIYHSGYTHSYFYDGTWNDNHGGIVVYDGETQLTYYHYDSEIEGFVGDYRFSMLESLDGDNCENLNEHCRVYLEGMGDYAGTLYKDVEIVPATVTDAKWGDLTWNLDASGNFTITGTGAMKSADTFRNYDWYNYSSYFTSITIGNGITTVAAAAFGGNSNTNPYASVTSVSLPESLTTIGESAFAYCTGASFNADDLIAQGVTYGANSFNQVGCLVGTLANNADNTEKIALLYQAARANVTLSDRTLYKDGAWNTIVLPFDIADINAKEEEVYTCPLHGATVMELDVDNKWAMVNSEWAIDNVNGTMQTGLVDGTLNLFFKPATSIESGKPYIIKWASGSNLENPVFNSVPVFVDNHNATSSDGKVVFKGTYGPVTWNTETKSILFLGDENKLYFPQPSGDDIPHLGAFRAYFELDPTAHVREFNLNFGEETSEATIISPAEIKEIADKADAAWYSLDGVKLDSKPTQKGLYLHGNRKVVIK